MVCVCFNLEKQHALLLRCPCARLAFACNAPGQTAMGTIVDQRSVAQGMANPPEISDGRSSVTYETPASVIAGTFGGGTGQGSLMVVRSARLARRPRPRDYAQRARGAMWGRDTMTSNSAMIPPGRSDQRHRLLHPLRVYWCGQALMHPQSRRRVGAQAARAKWAARTHCSVLAAPNRGAPSSPNRPPARPSPALVRRGPGLQSAPRSPERLKAWRARGAGERGSPARRRLHLLLVLGGASHSAR